MISIRNLIVTFEVLGDDKEVFQSLFQDAIAQYHRLASEAETREKLASRDRALGDRDAQA